MDKIDKIRAEILDKVKEYHQLKYGVATEFEPEVTPVNYAGRVFDEKELVNLVDSSLEFWLTYGRYSKKLENELSKFLDVKYALLVNSGSSANLLAFMALTSPMLGERRIERGDEVITVAAAFPTTVSPVIQFGAIPVFVDVDLSGNIDISQLEYARSPRTKAIMIAHSLGNPFDLNKIKAFCDNHGLWLVEDNCDALGSKYNGKYTGTFGDIGTSSFYPPHHITTGEGGAVYTNNPLLHKVMLSMRDWGRDCYCESGVDDTCKRRFSGQYGKLPFGYDHKYVYSNFGYNLKISDMQAAVGCAQLAKLEQFIKKRRENFNYLSEKLSELKDYIILPRATVNSEPSWFGFLMIVGDNVKFSRNDFSKYLEDKKIQTRNLFSGNIIKHPCFNAMKQNEDYRICGDLINTDRIMNDAVWIGVYPGMTQEKMDYMVEKIKEYVLNNK